MKQTITLVLFGFNLFLMCFVVAGLFNWQPLDKAVPAVEQKQLVQPVTKISNIEKMKTKLQIIPTDKVRTSLTIKPTLGE